MEAKEAKLCLHASRIVDRLWLGSEVAGRDLEALKAEGVTHVLIPANTGTQAVWHPEDITYLHVGLPDVSGFPILPWFPEFCDFIDDAHAKGGSVLVHCAQGVSRSPAAVIAWLMRSQKLGFREAHSVVSQARRVVNTKFIDQLELWEACHCDLEQLSEEEHKKWRKSRMTKVLFSNR